MKTKTALALLLLLLLVSCNYPVDEKAADSKDVPGIYVANDSYGRDTLEIRADGSYEERGGARMWSGGLMKGNWEMKGGGEITFDGQRPQIRCTRVTYAWQTPTGGIKIPINDDLGIHYIKENVKRN